MSICRYVGFEVRYSNSHRSKFVSDEFSNVVFNIRQWDFNMCVFVMVLALVMFAYSTYCTRAPTLTK